MTKRDKIDVDFPGNSKTGKEIIPITNQAKKKKASLGSKIVSTFVGEDIDDVAGYVVHDVVIPAVKNMFFDGLETLFFGRPRAGKKGRTGIIPQSGPGGNVSYHKPTTLGRPSRPEPRTVDTRAAHLFTDIEITNRADAEAVIMLLDERIQEYGSAAVADLYQSVSITPEFTDYNYGWTDLSTAYVKRERHGYTLKLPKPILLD